MANDSWPTKATLPLRLFAWLSPWVLGLFQSFPNHLIQLLKFLPLLPFQEGRLFIVWGVWNTQMWMYDGDGMLTLICIVSLLHIVATFSYDMEDTWHILTYFRFPHVSRRFKCPHMFTMAQASWQRPWALVTMEVWVATLPQATNPSNPNAAGETQLVLDIGMASLTTRSQDASREYRKGCMKGIWTAELKHVAPFPKMHDQHSWFLAVIASLFLGPGFCRLDAFWAWGQAFKILRRDIAWLWGRFGASGVQCNP